MILHWLRSNFEYHEAFKESWERIVCTARASTSEFVGDRTIPTLAAFQPRSLKEADLFTELFLPHAVNKGVDDRREVVGEGYPFHLCRGQSQGKRFSSPHTHLPDKLYFRHLEMLCDICKMSGK